MRFHIAPGAADRRAACVMKDGVITDVAPSPPWYRQVWPRLLRLFWLKTAGTTLIMWVFFIGYFHVLRHPAFALTTMPLTVVDEWIPFFAPAMLIYVSLWIYVPLAPCLLLGLRELITYGFWVAGLCAIGLLIFYYFPTTLPAYGIDRGEQWGFGILRGVDAAANACPSLHVATATFSFYWLDRVLRDMHAGTGARVFNLLWLVAIAFSTMATKQHVFLDVAAGFALGAALAWGSLWGTPCTGWGAHQLARKKIS
jgi:membrane-associated phospholipid phosphatase